jgi:thioredoxin-like negative regulator of GroEL
MNTLSHEEYLNILASDKSLQVVYFTAKWCATCKKLNLAAVLDRFKGLRWHLCDIDDNEETYNECGITKIPTFMAIVNGKPIKNTLQSSDADKVIEWLSEIIDIIS